MPYGPNDEYEDIDAFVKALNVQADLFVEANNKLRQGLSEEESNTLRQLLVEEVTSEEELNDTFEDLFFYEGEMQDWYATREQAAYLVKIVSIILIETPLIAGSRELLTDTALNMSLCPLHLIDYAICFDDGRAECAIIRHIHPSHDS
jgi:hypothetical protein